MRLVDVRSDAKGLPSVVHISPPAVAPRENWVTVLTGENGTRKSLLMRLIAGAALGKERFTSRGHQTARTTVTFGPGMSEKLHVFALSGTPNDRFPVIAGVPLDRTPTSFDIENYYYFGPSYAGGLATTSRAASTLAHSLLLDPDQTLTRWKAITTILRHMNFSPFIGLRLTPPRSKREENKGSDEKQALSSLDSIRDRANMIDSRLNSQEATRFSALRGYAAGILGDGPLYDRASALSGQTHRLEFKLSDDVARVQTFVDLNSGKEDYAHLIAMGFLKVDDLWFTRSSESPESESDGGRVTVGDLSSGQWQLLTGLLNLALNVVDDSLVLVDEPENSLHPQWQRDYVDLLSKAIGESVGCHVLIATHSPLIAAGVERRSGNLLSVQKMDGASVAIQQGTPVFGWRSDDVLREQFDMDSVRPPEWACPEFCV